MNPKRCAPGPIAAFVASFGLATVPAAAAPTTLLLGLGDSLTHGTMDATNNETNTLNAYLQKVAEALGEAMPLTFSQPLFDADGERIRPFIPPTNLGVDGSDIFSMEGLEYYKRAGVEASYLTDDYLCNPILPRRLDDKYDRVLYPLNLLNRAPASQIDGARWWLKYSSLRPWNQGLIVLWIGNNDSSTAALGTGGLAPIYQPLPFEAVASELRPGLRLLLKVAERQGVVSFAPFTESAILRNLTDLSDFEVQYGKLLDSLEYPGWWLPAGFDLFALTLPYYTGVGYLVDADDLEFYLRKLAPEYSVPDSFERPQPGQTVAVNGDRIALFTFVLMYTLLDTGHSIDEVNAILENEDGTQVDGLVLSEAEQELIVERIDGYNELIEAAVSARGPRMHLIDVGADLNDALTGSNKIVVEGRTFTRRWGRGHAFSMDGVHPGYTIQGYIANQVIAAINETTGAAAAARDLEAIMATDPYVDHDGDGWVPGPSTVGAGIPELLTLLHDPDDEDADLQPVLPADVWDQISAILLRSLLGIDAVRTEADHLGITADGSLTD
ncbi:hypothetical protein Thimo_0348 [Thioflavicoccus mobilis 8321]|uniref:SGNH hydrolase-type esterase domain-containing protein n=1 Tax=Thioflavicoccus mobilis 8321 TaxID=765912 RepID=L0GTS8_9GAMM|nr:hypothetical protein [Thioflavicoccus mobilis]AGA89217.1 hypothetical protein Thimo_0348 [Thioflavicoccus mobilis 8321]